MSNRESSLKAGSGNQYSYHLVVVPEYDTAHCESFETKEELLIALTGYVGKSVQAFPFFGERWTISKGMPPHLLTQSGNHMLLSPETLEPDPAGQMYRDLSNRKTANTTREHYPKYGDDA